MSPGHSCDLTCPVTKPDVYYTYPSGGLGWDAPAAVGIALAQEDANSGRPVVAMIGDGSMQYSVQCLATAAQNKVKVIYIVLCNGEYAVLKELAMLENTPNVPALDLPTLDVVSIAKGFACNAVAAHTKQELQAAFSQALSSDGPTLIAVPIQHQIRSLVPKASA